MEVYGNTRGDSPSDRNRPKGAVLHRTLIGLYFQRQNKQYRRVKASVCERKKNPPFRALVVRHPIALMEKPPLELTTIVS